LNFPESTLLLFFQEHDIETIEIKDVPSKTTAEGNVRGSDMNNTVSESDEKENVLEETRVENSTDRKKNGKGKKRTEKDWVGEKSKKGGDENGEKGLVEHGVNTESAVAETGLDGKQVVTVETHETEGGGSEKDGQAGGTERVHVCETTTAGNCETDEVKVPNKSKKERKNKVKVEGENDTVENAKEADDQNESSDAIVTKNEPRSSPVDDIHKYVTKPEIVVSNSETLNSNNNATDLASDDDLVDDLDIEAGSDLDLAVPSFPSFSSAKVKNRMKGKKAKSSKKRRSSKGAKHSGEGVEENEDRDR
jgi:hypothetical protein